jgi:hypothetical protein
MRKLLFILIVSLSSCASYKEKYLQTIRLNPIGIVQNVDHKNNIFTVRYHCTEPPYKRQPCYKDVHFDLREVDYVDVGVRF